MAEACLRVAPDGGAGGPTIMLVPPLFDEANRLRRTLVLMMRALADIGHASLMPDLPGQNDSLIPTEAVTLAQWRTALATHAEAINGPYLVASWRGGTLIDDAARHPLGWWRMAPVAGASLLKTMFRTRIAGEKEAGRSVTVEQLRAAAGDRPIELAGNRLSAAMLAELEAATPADVARLRQVTPGAGDGQVPGSALWLRAEPGEDGAMAAAMAADISAWAATCAAG